jgi:hypothetical protein
LIMPLSCSYVLAERLSVDRVGRVSGGGVLNRRELAREGGSAA